MVLEDSTSRTIVLVVSHKTIFKVLPSEDEALPVIQDGGQGGGSTACQWYRKTQRRVKLPASEAEALLDAGVDIEGDGIRATPCSL
jgi:hypothetical protein